MSQQASTAEPPYDPVESSSMTLMEHLKELRLRLMWMSGALIVGTLVAMIFTWQVVEIINRPLGGAVPQVIGPTDAISVFFKVALATGAALAMPVIMYQLIAFVAPGLYPHERRNLLIILPGIMILFMTGVVFAYFIMLPPAIGFLQRFGGEQLRTDWTAPLYIGFVTRVTFWIGAAFQMPLVIAFLARAGITSGPSLLRYWRHSIVIVSIAAAIITPTIDPINMTIVMMPLIGLYFLSVGIAYLVYRPRVPRDFSEEPFVKDDE
jgi:sec-independent protein translocase protein TatC